MKILIVDDDLSRTEAIVKAIVAKTKRHPDVWMAQSARAAINILEYFQERRWDAIFLDHDLLGSLGYFDEDLGDEGEDGRSVARAMVELGVDCKHVVVQSVNPGGSPAIKQILVAGGFSPVTLAPYPDALNLINGVPRAKWHHQNWPQKPGDWRRQWNMQNRIRV